MRFKISKFTKTHEIPEEEPVQDENATFTEVVGMEEKIINKTRELQDAAKQLKGLYDSAISTEEDEDDTPVLHGPLIELTVEPVENLVDLDAETEASRSIDTSEKEQKIIVVALSNKKPVKATNKRKKEIKNKQGEATKQDDMPQRGNDESGNFFSAVEEEPNPLANLIKTLPEVSTQEILNELEEIKEIIWHRQQN